MQLAGYGNMEEHIAQVSEYIEELKALGEELFNDKWIVGFLLNSLPCEYDTLITALESRRDNELTLVEKTEQSGRQRTDN
ncbi:hypothetical protein JTB14_020462 [Gonioctena quinquepunctata]|nr:hypothetical protein JTB14_020462 [Gonioctena quinquepunctata]